VESVVDDGFDFIENRHTVGSESGLELAWHAFLSATTIPV
jgi:hypothetical protein